MTTKTIKGDSQETGENLQPLAIEVIEAMQSLQEDSNNYQNYLAIPRVKSAGYVGNLPYVSYPEYNEQVNNWLEAFDYSSTDFYYHYHPMDEDRRGDSSKKHVKQKQLPLQDLQYLAEALGISTEVIYEWKSSKESGSSAISRRDDWYGDDESAQGGSLYLRAIPEEKADVNYKVPDFSEVDAEDAFYAYIASNIHARIRSRLSDEPQKRLEMPDFSEKYIALQKQVDQQMTELVSSPKYNPNDIWAQRYARWYALSQAKFNVGTMHSYALLEQIAKGTKPGAERIKSEIDTKRSREREDFNLSLLPEDAIARGAKYLQMLLWEARLSNIELLDSIEYYEGFVEKALKMTAYDRKFRPDKGLSSNIWRCVELIDNFLSSSKDKKEKQALERAKNHRDAYENYRILTLLTAADEEFLVEVATSSKDENYNQYNNAIPMLARLVCVTRGFELMEKAGVQESEMAEMVKLITKMNEMLKTRPKPEREEISSQLRVVTGKVKNVRTALSYSRDPFVTDLIPADKLGQFKTMFLTELNKLEKFPEDEEKLNEIALEVADGLSES